MCFDQYGNIIVTGTVKTNVFDIYTAGFKPEDGTKIWDDVYDAPYHGLDKAFDITCDANGYIYVTGTAEADTGFGTVTLKYRTDYYTEPGQLDTPAVSYLFYPNSGQIINTDGKTNNGVDYYTQHHYPQLYFREGEMNMVWAHIDQDTATADTMQRVDVSFLGSSNPTKAFPIKERDDAGYLNYFLGHCPNGITQVYGNESLLFEGVYSGIDAIYSSNNAGLKLYFVCAAQSDPSNIGLKFEGQDNVQIVNNWGLEVQTLLGTYEFEKPRVYQLDGSGNRITLPWTLSWTMNASDEAKFTGWGNYDRDKTLVIEIGNQATNSIVGCVTDNLCWATYIGGPRSTESSVMRHDKNGYIYQTGITNSTNFPTVGSAIFFYPIGRNDAFLVKYNQYGNTTGHTNIKWATYFGGKKDDKGTDIAIADNSDVYLLGITHSDYINDHFPYTPSSGTNAYNQLDLNFGNGYASDAFIMRLDGNGNTPKWIDWIGGDMNDEGLAIVIDDAQNIFIAGTSESDQTQTHPFPHVNSGGNAYYQDEMGDDLKDAFLMKFNSDDELIWSTYIGGDKIDKITSLCLLQDDGIALTGSTESSTDVQTTPPFDASIASSPPQFPIIYNSASSEWCQTNNQGEADAFVMVFDNALNLNYSTLFGGDGTENSELNISSFSYLGGIGRIISTSPPSKNLFLIGTSTSTSNFPVHDANPGGNTNYFQPDLRGHGDIFIAKLLNNNGIYSQGNSTFYGGSGDEFSGDIVVDVYGNVYVCGATTTNQAANYVDYCLVPGQNPNGYFSFPMCQSTGEYFDKTFAGDYTDAFILRLNNSDELTWSTYLGGNSSSNPHPLRETINGLTISGYGSSSFLYFGGYTDDVLTFPEREDPPLYFLPVCLGPQCYRDLEALVGRFTLPFTTGIQEKLSTKGLLIYPNPCSSTLCIETINKIDNIESIDLVDQLGRTLLQNKYTNSYSSKVNLDISSLPPSIYLIRVRTSKDIFNQKFIKS